MQAVFPRIRHVLRALRAVVAGFYDWIPRRTVIAMLSIAALGFIGFLTAQFWLADTIVLVGVVVALAALGVWKIPQWQAETAVRRDRERDRFETENAARGTLAQALSGLVVVIGLAFAWRQLEDTRRDQINQETLTREGQITGRFTAAVGQLGDDQLQVRLGGVYALERIARDSKEDTVAVMEVLTAFVRQRSPWPIPAGTATLDSVDAGDMLRPFEDVEAVLTVINRGRWAEQWASGEERFPLGCLDLSGTNLHGARVGGSERIRLCLQGANLLDADLQRADLQRADLQRADLAGANLVGADLRRAVLLDADLPRADLSGALLSDADLSGADLSGAELLSADLLDANLSGADLSGANLSGAILLSANLSGADLRGADLRPAPGLTQTQLDVAVVDETTQLPPDLSLPATPPASPVHSRVRSQCPCLRNGPAC